MIRGNLEPGDWFEKWVTIAALVVSGWLRSSESVRAQTSCAAAPPGLISWWRAEDSALDAVAGNNGAALGGAGYLSGKVGDAFSFNGISATCIRIPYAASLGSPAYTIEAWVNPVVPISDPANQKVIFAQNAGRAQLVLKPGTTGARVLFQFFTGPSSWSVLKSAVEIPLNQFTHVAASWDGATQRLYLNGVLSSQAKPAGAPWDSGCDFFIGGINSSGGSCQYAGQFFQGLLDEVSYYRRALSEAEIQTLFDAGNQGKCDPAPASTPANGAGVSPKTFALDLQRRDPISGQSYVTRKVFQGNQLAVIVMDVWNSHPDPEMSSRGSALIPRLNEALDAARSLGITVIFSPNTVPLPAGVITNAFAGLPNRTPIDNGFDPPLPSYADAVAGDMIPIAYDVAFAPRFPTFTSQHPDLLVRPGDLASTSRQQVFNYCAARGITHLLYVGVAANMCVCWARETAMIGMKRYCGLEPILVRDLTDSMTLNSRKRTGGDNGVDNFDLTMTPDQGHRQVVAQNETYICSSIDARQLLQYLPSAAYANLITGEPSLLCFWPMDSKADYQEILDARRIQSCWWNRNDVQQTSGLNFGTRGAIVNDPDTALQFSQSTVLISPLYRDDIPTNNPLASLSSTNFTLETWVRFDLLNSNQWFYSHDNGVSNGVDVLLGLNANNHFQFVVGASPTNTGFGDTLQSVATVTPDDVNSKRWFHVVAIHDIDQASVSLYLNGVLDTQTNHSCMPVLLATAPHLGSRGLATLGRSRYLASRGFGFLYGSLDETAVYSAALSADAIALHYRTAQGQATSPFLISARPQQAQLILNWSSWPLGLRLQTSDDFSSWEDSSVPIEDMNGVRQAVIPMSKSLEFFRLALP